MRSERRSFEVALSGSWGLFRGEVTRWLRWRGLFHAVLWLVVIDGFLYFSVVTEHQPLAGLGFERLLNMLVVLPPIVAIVITAAEVCGSYHDGTTAWQLGKPVPRSGHVIATIGSLWVGLTMTTIVIPGAFAYWWLPRVEPYRFVTPEAPPLGRFTFTLAVLAAILLLFIALTAFVSVVTRRRSVAAVVGMWVLIMMRGALTYPSWYDYTPARLIRTDLAAGRWSELIEYIYGNAFGAASAVWGTLGIALVFGMAAIVVFRRLEF